MALETYCGQLGTIEIKTGSWKISFCSVNQRLQSVKPSVSCNYNERKSPHLKCSIPKSCLSVSRSAAIVVRFQMVDVSSEGIADNKKLSWTTANMSTERNAKLPHIDKYW